MKATASFAISAIELGVLPSDAPTPRLSKVITRRCEAMPSTTRGIPVVQDRREVVEEDDWRTGPGTQVPVGEGRAADIHCLGRGVLVRGGDGHWSGSLMG